MIFPDPASVYELGVVYTHHKVMNYIVLILCLVFWVLFLILKDFTWGYFIEQFRVFRFLINIVNKLLIICSFVMYNLYYFLNKFLLILVISNQKKEILDKKKVYLLSFLKQRLSLNTFFNISVNKSIFFWLNNITSSGYFFFYKITKLEKIWFSGFTYNYCKEVNKNFNFEFLTVQDFKHKTSFEFIWAIFPNIVISFILVPSLYLLYSLDEDCHPIVNISVTGHQWFWSYENKNWLPLFSNKGYEYFLQNSFESCLMKEEDLIYGSNRLLQVDNPLYLPVYSNIRFLITSADVLHAWAVPNLGIKIDAVPGRLNQFLTYIINFGTFYGQCSELCGVDHGFMPIVIKAVQWNDYFTYSFSHYEAIQVEKNIYIDTNQQINT